MRLLRGKITLAVHRGICVPLDTNLGRAPTTGRPGHHHLAMDPGWDLLHPLSLQNSIQRLARPLPYGIDLESARGEQMQDLRLDFSAR